MSIERFIWLKPENTEKLLCCSFWQCFVDFPGAALRATRPSLLLKGPTGMEASGADQEDGTCIGIEFRPADLARRQIVAWRGLSGEFVQTIRREAFEIDHRGRFHLLIAYECAQRDKGETIVDGLPRSTLRDLTRKLVFVPAGAGFREWHEPRSLLRAIYLHLDPANPFMRREDGGEPVMPAPRLFFESPMLWQTALKLKSLIEAGPSASRSYGEALAAVLAHELLDTGRRVSAPRARGGLATWQRRAAIQYIEAHLAEEISIADLSAVSQLSPFHFARAFKQSFGVPPHRYHIARRIERAKMLLANRDRLLLQIAIDLGFNQASSFSVMFRRVTGQTPSDYRRSLV
jgi:AraC family transcriptional regulator